MTAGTWVAHHTDTHNMQWKKWKKSHFTLNAHHRHTQHAIPLTLLYSWLCLGPLYLGLAHHTDTHNMQWKKSHFTVFKCPTQTYTTCYTSHFVVQLIMSRSTLPQSVGEDTVLSVLSLKKSKQEHKCARTRENHARGGGNASRVLVAPWSCLCVWSRPSAFPSSLRILAGMCECWRDYCHLCVYLRELVRVNSRADSSKERSITATYREECLVIRGLALAQLHG